ncbi:hypothetical protein EXIGLDRAFT_717235 [Exidia glandulosa HHB12029]|uniref:Uncharacterized protein n=1 Tax=Exidia glandulosa HHB12029 TaxID=1314781 RepID=A0A165P4U3_EXIGL|nr:hypothetical protein EXIGLDRAFT_717235 [Exidia glandulosa HHB12029]
MKLSVQLVFAAVLYTSVRSRPLSARDASDEDIARLAPDLGFAAGVNPTGTGDCDGAVNGPDGRPIKVPCSCPPSRDVFLQHLQGDVHAGHAVNHPDIPVNFPTDDSRDAQLARIDAAKISLQNLFGSGVGCPVAATTLLAQEAAVRSGNAPPPPPVAAPPPPPPEANTAPPPPADNGGDDIARLAPPLGHAAGINPTGTGDCDGAVLRDDGTAVKVPCNCPPSQDVYINALRANVQAGHAVNQPSVPVSFPTDDSINSQITRIQAALISLQNLNGSGVGCPAASTTLLAQQKALQQQQ